MNFTPSEVATIVTAAVGAVVAIGAALWIVLSYVNAQIERVRAHSRNGAVLPELAARHA